jgi:hypothetical protein
MARTFTIEKRLVELGGGWNVRMFEDGEEDGRGIFPIGEYDGTPEEREKAAYQDALEEGEAWVAEW